MICLTKRIFLVVFENDSCGKKVFCFLENDLRVVFIFESLCDEPFMQQTVMLSLCLCVYDAN
jgi:hypothetical protein